MNSTSKLNIIGTNQDLDDFYDYNNDEELAQNITNKL